MAKEIKRDRRHFLRTAALTVAASELSMLGFVETQSPKTDFTNMEETNKFTMNFFSELKQVNAGELNIGYAEEGSTNNTAVILLHGWPYDIHSFAEVSPLLVSGGYRVIIPHLRGYGTTKFLSGKTLRNGQQSVLALDVINLMDALKISKATVAGFDWGARTANIVAALCPERCKAM